MIGPLKKAIIDLPIRLKGNFKRTSGNLFNPLGSHNKHLGAASQALLTWVKLRLRRRLPLQRKKEAVVERWPLKRGLNTSIGVTDNVGLTVFYRLHMSPNYDPQMFHMKVSGRVSCSY